MLAAVALSKDINKFQFTTSVYSSVLPAFALHTKGLSFIHSQTSDTSVITTSETENALKMETESHPMLKSRITKHESTFIIETANRDDDVQD